MIDGTYILMVIIGLLFLYAIHRYASWERWDHYRRHQRLVHRNLQRMAGRR